MNDSRLFFPSKVYKLFIYEQLFANTFIIENYIWVYSLRWIVNIFDLLTKAESGQGQSLNFDNLLDFRRQANTGDWRGETIRPGQSSEATQGAGSPRPDLLANDQDDWFTRGG